MRDIPHILTRRILHGTFDRRTGKRRHISHRSSDAYGFPDVFRSFLQILFALNIGDEFSHQGHGTGHSGHVQCLLDAGLVSDADDILGSGPLGMQNSFHSLATGQTAFAKLAFDGPQLVDFTLNLGFFIRRSILQQFVQFIQSLIDKTRGTVMSHECSVIVIGDVKIYTGINIFLAASALKLSQ